MPPVRPFSLYDANGSLETKITTVDSTETEQVIYAYNLRNRLSEAKVSTDGGSSWDSVTEYTYDPDGNRVSKTVDGTTTTTYLIDSLNHTGYAQVFVEDDGTNQTSYIIGDDVLAQTTGATESDIQYLLYDGHGSTRQLTNTNRTVITGESYSYDSYGVLLGGPRSTQTSLLYTGEMYDSYAEMYYLRARYYAPSTGRFNRIDPFAGSPQDPQSLHKYLYCHADPVNGTDPSGMMELIDLAKATAIRALLSAIAFTVTSVVLDFAYGVGGMQMLRNALFVFGATVLAVMSAPFAIALIGSIAISLGVKALTEGLTKEDGVRVAAFLLVAILLSIIFKNCAFTSKTSGKGNCRVAETFKNAKYRKVTLKQGTRLQRVYEQGSTRPIGRYTMRGKTTRAIKSSQDAIDVLNLRAARTKPTHMVTVEVTEPVEAWVGKIEGGGSSAFQYWISDVQALKVVEGSEVPLSGAH